MEKLGDRFSGILCAIFLTFFFCKSKNVSEFKVEKWKKAKESKRRKPPSAVSQQILWRDRAGGTKYSKENGSISLPTALDTIWSLSLEWFIQKIISSSVKLL